MDVVVNLFLLLGRILAMALLASGALMSLYGLYSAGEQRR